jgi:hypothetical protein
MREKYLKKKSFWVDVTPRKVKVKFYVRRKARRTGKDNKGDGIR